jgi:hypothetical protein
VSHAPNNVTRSRQEGGRHSFTDAPGESNPFAAAVGCVLGFYIRPELARAYLFLIDRSERAQLLLLDGGGAVCFLNSAVF